MVQALSDPEPDVRAMVAKSLAAPGRNSGIAVPALIKSLRDDSPKVREAAGNALSRIDPQAAAKAAAL